MLFRSSVVISDSDGSKIYYNYTTSSMVVGAPDKRPSLPSVDVEFVLSQDILDKILKCSSILGFPNISIESDGESVCYRGYDVSNNSIHNYVKPISDVDPGGKKYKLIFRTENLKMFPASYSVEISSRGIAKFTGVTEPLVYFVTIETSSEY